MLTNKLNNVTEFVFVKVVPCSFSQKGVKLVLNLKKTKNSYWQLRLKSVTCTRSHSFWILSKICQKLNRYEFRKSIKLWWDAWGREHMRALQASIKSIYLCIYQKWIGIVTGIKPRGIKYNQMCLCININTWESS